MFRHASYVQRELLVRAKKQAAEADADVDLEMVALEAEDDAVSSIMKPIVHEPIGVRCLILCCEIRPAVDCMQSSIRRMPHYAAATAVQQRCASNALHHSKHGFGTGGYMCSTAQCIATPNNAKIQCKTCAAAVHRGICSASRIPEECSSCHHASESPICRSRTAPRKVLNPLLLRTCCGCSQAERMKKAISVVQDNFNSLRTGRANPAILDRITVGKLYELCAS